MPMIVPEMKTCYRKKLLVHLVTHVLNFYCGNGEEITCHLVHGKVGFPHLIAPVMFPYTVQGPPDS